MKALSPTIPYDNVRDEQKHLIPLISKYLKEGYENIIVELPTGSGKSMIAYALPLIFDSSAYISTPLKGLQEQYLRATIHLCRLLWGEQITIAC